MTEPNNKIQSCPADTSRYIPLEANSDAEVPLYLQTMRTRGFPDASDSQVCVTEEGEYKFGPVGTYVPPGQTPQQALKATAAGVQAQRGQLESICNDYAGELRAKNQGQGFNIPGGVEAVMGFFHGLLTFGLGPPTVDALSESLIARQGTNSRFYKAMVHQQMYSLAAEKGLICTPNDVSPLEPYGPDITRFDLWYLAKVLGLPLLFVGGMFVFTGEGGELSEEQKSILSECFDIELPDPSQVPATEYSQALQAASEKIEGQISNWTAKLTELRKQNIAKGFSKDISFWEQHGFTTGGFLSLALAFSHRAGAGRFYEATRNLGSTRGMRFARINRDHAIKGLEEKARHEAEQRLAQLVNTDALKVCQQGQEGQAKQAAAKAWAAEILARDKKSTTQTTHSAPSSEPPQAKQRQVQVQPAIVADELQSLYPDFKVIEEKEGFMAAKDAYYAMLLDLQQASQTVVQQEAWQEVQSQIATLNQRWALFQQAYYAELNNPRAQGPQLTNPSSPVQNPSQWAKRATEAMVKAEAKRFLRLARPTAWANNPFAEKEALAILKDRIIYLSKELKAVFVDTLRQELDITSLARQEYYLRQHQTRAWNGREPTNILEAIIADRIRTRDIQIDALDLVHQLMGPREIAEELHHIHYFGRNAYRIPFLIDTAKKKNELSQVQGYLDTPLVELLLSEEQIPYRAGLLLVTGQESLVSDSDWRQIIWDPILNENARPIALKSDREIYTQLAAAVIMIIMTRSVMGAGRTAVMEEAVVAEEAVPAAEAIIPNVLRLTPPQRIPEYLRRVGGM